MSFGYYIKEYEDVLSADECAELIRKFESDTDNQYPGRAGYSGDSPLKVSTDLSITSSPGWERYDNLIYERLSPKLTEYIDFLSESFVGLNKTTVGDTGYQIQRTRISEKYDWHDDSSTNYIMDSHRGNRANYKRRFATFIFYLNDGFDGGRTQFRDGCDIISVNPKVGKLLLFPATPMFVHRGEVVTDGVKYLITGWADEVVTDIVVAR